MSTSCLFFVTWLTVAASTPLIITPYLESNDADTARSLSRVTPDLGNVTSYSGYFTVNKNCGDNLFFWFFPAVDGWEDAPVILWLQGGPGSSSMYGLFELNGPFNSLADGLKSRNTSWTNFANVLYIDNPVDTGFSFTTEGCYPTNLTSVTEELYSALTQFFQLFPNLKNNKFFLTGESFAGHYIPVLGALIDENNSDGEIRINLKGIVIGNAEMKLTCHDYGTYFYQVGMADVALRDELHEAQKSLREHVKRGNHTAAHEDWMHILYDLVGDKMGWTYLYTIRNEPADPSNYIDYLNYTSEVRNQIHVGSQTFIDFNNDVYQSLVPTITPSYTHYVERLLRTRKYIVAFYSGNMDWLCMYSSAVCIMRGLKWPGRAEYLNATRHPWLLDGKVVGWFKTSDNLLLDILVKDAQHAAIYSQPEVTYRMMKSIASAQHGQNPLWALNTTSSTSLV